MKKDNLTMLLMQRYATEWLLLAVTVIVISVGVYCWPLWGDV